MSQPADQVDESNNEDGYDSSIYAQVSENELDINTSSISRSEPNRDDILNRSTPSYEANIDDINNSSSTSTNESDDEEVAKSSKTSTDESDDEDIVNCSLFSLVFSERNQEVISKIIDCYGSLSHVKGWSSDGYALLCDSTERDHTALSEILLKKGCKVNSDNNKNGNEPLHFAASHGNIGIVKILLEKGANVNAKCEYGRIPLFYAIHMVDYGCRHNYLQVIKLLLIRGSDVNVKDKDGATPLHFAIKKRCLKIVSLLLVYGSDINCVLHYSVEQDWKEGTIFLLNRGANVNFKEEDDVTPLHIAARKGNMQIAEVLLKHGACIDSITMKKKCTPLYFAICSGNELLIKLLLQYGAQVDKQDKSGRSILYIAVKTGDLTVIQEILKYYPDINNQSNRNSLKAAVCGKKEKKVVEALLEYGFNVNLEDINNTKLLHNAINMGYLKIVEDLLRYGADVNLTLEGFTPLHSAVQNEQYNITKLLISYKADVNAKDKTGKSSIYYAVKNMDLQIFETLLANKASVKDYPELLHIAVEKKCVVFIEALLQQDVDINSRDEHGMTPLHSAVINKDEEITKLLISYKADINAKDNKGNIPIYYAIKNTNLKVFEALLPHVRNINLCDEDGNTALHYSALAGDKRITTMLLKNGAYVNANQSKKCTPLYFAVKEGHSEIVKILLEFGADVDSETIDGCRPLHMAAAKGHPEIIATLLKFGAEINSRGDGGRTALHYASHFSNTKTVRTLLKYGSDVNLVCDENLTPFDYSEPYCNAAEVLMYQIIRMKTANLYLLDKNLLATNDNEEINQKRFIYKCEKEIVKIKSENIKNTKISFFDLLVGDTSSLLKYIKNENVMQVYKCNYISKFPIYANIIKNNLIKAMKRHDLTKKVNEIFYFIFKDVPVLPCLCTEKIFSYLNDKDLRAIIDAAASPQRFLKRKTQFTIDNDKKKMFSEPLYHHHMLI